MSQIELPYDELKQEMIKELEKHKELILSTSQAEKVTSRTMRCITDGLTIYCQTANKSRKYIQMTANPNVALASGNLQVEGVAKLKGRPIDEENISYLKVLKEKVPEAYAIWSERGHFQNPAQRVIEISPHRMALYKGAVSPLDTGILILDIWKEKAFKITRASTKGEQF